MAAMVLLHIAMSFIVVFTCIHLLQVSFSFGQMSTTRVREMAPLMEGQRVSFPWSSVVAGRLRTAPGSS